MSPVRTSRRGFLRFLGKALLAGTGATIGGYAYVTRLEPGWIQVERVTIAIPGLNDDLDGLRLVHVSDIHLYPYTELDLVQTAVNLINRQLPDVVLMSGDFVTERTEGAEAIEDLVPVLSALNPRLGSFACLGNHDWWCGPGVVRQGLRKAGVVVLDSWTMRGWSSSTAEPICISPG